MNDLNIDLIGGQDYIKKQLVKHLSLLHDLDSHNIGAIDKCLPSTIIKVQYCWSQISNKYYNRNDAPSLDINNSNQYAQLLLILAHDLSVNGYSSLADKFFGLNKMLNSCDIYHEVILPKSFYIDHTLGIVVGRADLGNRLFLSQNCTIGSNPGSPHYPILGSDNYLMANVTLVGNVKTSDRVIFSAGSFVKDIEIPPDSIVYGRSPDITIKKLKPDSYKKASPFIV